MCRDKIDATAEEDADAAAEAMSLEPVDDAGGRCTS